jgi:hypothetical protein
MLSEWGGIPYSSVSLKTYIHLRDQHELAIIPSPLLCWALPFLPPPCADSLAPLSLSSDGPAGRSDWKRGGRPSCTVCREMLREPLLRELSCHRQEGRCYLLLWSGRGSPTTRTGRVHAPLRLGFFSRPPSYACLLPSVAGSGSLTAGCSSLAASVKILPLFTPSVGSGVGRPPYRACLRWREHAVKSSRPLGPSRCWRRVPAKV